MALVTASRTLTTGGRLRQAAPTSGSHRGLEGGLLQSHAHDGIEETSTLAFYASAGFKQNKTSFQVRRVTPRLELPD